MAQSKKTKLKEIKNIDGQDDSAEGVQIVAQPQKVYRSLDELFNFHGANYKTYVEDEYALSLSNMNKIYLRDECWRVGLQPNDNRNIMIERLMKQFRRVTASINSSQMKPVRLKSTPELRAVLLDGANKAQ